MPTLQMESRAHLAFRSSPLWVLRNLDVEETDSTVILRGIVFTYYQKQQALETIRPWLAGRELLNCIEVQSPE